MALEQYLRIIDTAFRNHDGPSMARCFSARAEDIPFSKDFVPYLQQVKHSAVAVALDLSTCRDDTIGCTALYSYKLYKQYARQIVYFQYDYCTC